MKYSFPANYGEECIIVAIDKALVPLVAGALKPFEQSYSWLSDEDYEQGYNAFAELQASFMNNCLSELVESNRQIYRLLDTALNGAAYTAEADPESPGDLVVTPAIPAAPPASSPAVLNPYALRRRIERLINLVDNQVSGATFSDSPAWLSDGALNDNQGERATIRAMQGFIDAGWFGIGGQRATIANVVEALRIGSPQDAATIDTALEALSAASSTANVFSIVRDLLADVTGAGLEGATLGTLIAASIANAATQGVLSGQLDRIIAALDGGGLVAPEDSVLERLRTVDQNIADIETMVS